MSLVNLQKKIGVTADGAFGPGTLRAACAHYKLNRNRGAHFFAQCAHESGNWRATSENLNYSSQGLRNIFRKYFPTVALANQYARKPQAIANRVYANRMGNGPESSGDGWKFRGRGFLQLTGHDNYKALSQYINRPDIMDNPDLVAGELAIESALWFFDRNKLWAICDQGITDGAILALTRRINGGTHGLADRNAKTKKYATWL